MEANRKLRKGFTKGKLVMSFYRAVKPPSTMQYSNKVKPSNPTSTTTSVDFHVDKKEFVVPPSNKKVSFVNPESSVEKKSFSGGGGGGVPGDESVDMKAASYISYVQERFRLERNALEQRNRNEIQC